MLNFEWTKKHTTVLLYTCATIILAIAIVLILLFPARVGAFIGEFFSAVSPVFFGFVIAYLINPVCTFFEKKVFKKIRIKKKFVRALSVVCALVAVLAVIGLFVGMMVPQIVSSYLSLEKKIEGYAADVTEWFGGLIAEILEHDQNGLLVSLFNTEKILSAIDGIVGSAFGFVGNVANAVLQYSSKILSVASNVIVTVIFAIYFLLEKDVLFTWISKLSGVAFSASFNASARKWISFTDDVFSSFISGKILNALLITVLNFIVFGIFGIPYYPLIALITGITDMIPYFGPFIGAIPCAFIILIADPVKVLWFAALVLVIQQKTAYVVGPKILGEKVGVDSLLIIVAITVSGGLFGIAGMFVGVPVFTVLYHAVMEFLEGRLKKKGLPTENRAYSKSEKGAAR